MIVNIRGGHGAGKTYLVRKVMEKLGIRKTIKKHGRVLGYKLDRKVGSKSVYVVGRYQEGLTAEGCDVFKGYHDFFKEGFNQADLVCKLVRKFCKKGHVLFEGMVSGAVNRWIFLVQELKSQKFVFGFPDVSVERCLKRVRHRREAKGNFAPLNEEHTRSKYKAVHITGRKHFEDAELDCRSISQRKPHKQVIGWMAE